MKLLSIALVFVGTGALACPADDVKDAQADMKDKPAAEAKAPVRAPATKAVASRKTQQSTKVADKAATEAARKSSL
jgi:hypothetical protein